MKIFNIVLAAVAFAIITSCASINNPEGGPKDEKAPILLESNPKRGELNVSTSTITLDFDEEVQPSNLTKELLITPFSDNKYKVKTSKTRLELIFEEPFEENTTYTFNFRKGIEDITEKNKAEALTLTFSTGSFIDSSRVSGKVLQLLTQQPEKETVVALYPTSDTLSIRKSRPYYQTETNAAGEFKFENIKEGEYRIYALVDKNNNSLYNEEERIAYRQEPIQVTPTDQEVLLQTIRIDTRKPLLQRRERYLDRFVANYNEGLSTFFARPETSPKDTLIHKISADGKVVDLFGDSRFTGGRAILTAIDSAENRTVDTVQIAFEGKRAQRVKGAKLKESGNASNGTFSVGQPITIELETPVRITAKQPIGLYLDSVEVVKINYPEQITLDRTMTEITFLMPKWTSNNRQAAIRLDSVGIVPVQGERLSFQPLPFTVAEARGAGSLKGSITTENKSYIVQLLDSQFKIKREARNVKIYDFRNIEPGTYTIRIILDANNNGRWDGGDPELKREPEQVYLHEKQLEIRANWEMEENIKF